MRRKGKIPYLSKKWFGMAFQLSLELLSSLPIHAKHGFHHNSKIYKIKATVFKWLAHDVSLDFIFLVFLQERKEEALSCVFNCTRNTHQWSTVGQLRGSLCFGLKGFTIEHKVSCLPEVQFSFNFSNFSKKVGIVVLICIIQQMCSRWLGLYYWKIPQSSYFFVLKG